MSLRKRSLYWDMIRHDKSIRLTPKEKKEFSNLAGEIPEVKTVEGLNRFIDQSLKQYGDTPVEKVLKHLLEMQKIPE